MCTMVSPTSHQPTPAVESVARRLARFVISCEMAHARPMAPGNRRALSMSPRKKEEVKKQTVSIEKNVEFNCINMTIIMTMKAS